MIKRLHHIGIAVRTLDEGAAAWDERGIGLEASARISVELLPWPGANDEVGDHLCLVVASKDPVERFELRVTVGL